MLEGPSTTVNHTARLAESQETHARKVRAEVNPHAVLFTFYTVYGNGRNAELVSRYFNGASLYRVAGLWKSEREDSEVIEVVGTMADLQKAIDLAGDIRTVQEQSAVLMTYARLGSVLVTE
jgi:hypothetical protein